MSKKLNMAAAISLSVIGLFGTCPHAYAGGPFTNKNKLGDVMMVMSPAYAYGMTAMANDFTGTLELTGSIIAAQMASEGIKMLNLERRPNGTDRKSLPSGHAAGAFSGAMFVHKRYGWKPALIPYGMSLIAGWSRVEARAHYWHDVAAGAAVSALFTWALVDKYVPSNVCVDVATDGAHIGFKTEF